MELYSNKTASANTDMQLYRALSAGDLPAARLLSKNSDGENPASAFNRGLCLFLLEEWEASLAELRCAEQLLGNPPEYDISERTLFIRAIELSKHTVYLLPLDPDSTCCERYALIRVKWLAALCLVNLGRGGEAAPVKRFLSQYNIEI